MRRLLTVLILAAVAVPAAAQDRPREREREREDRIRIYMRPPEMALSFRRERLGVLVDLTPDPARDSVGARVAGVTPGGPADRAGVRAGDLVVRMNGVRLAAPRSDERRREGAEVRESRPGLRLIELAAQLSGGDSVQLELRREGRPVAVTLVAAESGFDRILELHGEEFGPLLRGVPFPELPGMRSFSFSLSGSLADLELVRVNPGLSEYFGTSEGLLVVDVPDTSTLGLRAGDVILTIGGRRPTSPSHGFRILSTYDANETVTFEIMRQRRRTTITGRMPQAREWRVRRNSFELPAAPPFPALPEFPKIRITPRLTVRVNAEV